MAGRIPPQFIDELLNRVDIVDLISSRMQLKKAGKDFQACCPFHDEKTPSFTVSRDKQFYHCFGCGAHGTAIGFMMEYDNLGFPEAVEELAQREGIEVPREAGDSSQPDYRPLYAMLEEASRFYRWQLRSHPQTDRAVAYLKQRGLSGEIATEFSIGFAPPGWDNLIRQFGDNEKGLEQLRVTGMISEPEGKCYDRFRDRIMFPIRDQRGRVIAFGGRILGEGKPKYLNSPETPIFHKGRELYGLYEARKALRNLDRLLVVEGYMDVVALAQFGIRYAVATLGTATTPEHLERLFRTTGEIVFCFDGDRAGREAAWKALNTTLPHMRDGRDARFLFLPDGEDPDTLIRKEGADRFEQMVHEATPLSDFLFRRLQQEVDMETPAGRAKLAQLASPLIARLPKGVFHELMQKSLDELVGIELVPKQQGAKPARSGGSSPNRSGARMTITPVRRAIALLLNEPQLALLPDLPREWQRLHLNGITLLSELLALIQKQPTLKPSQIIERWHGSDMYQHLNKLVQVEFPLTGEQMESEFRDTLGSLDELLRKEELDLLRQKFVANTLTPEEKERLNLLLRGESNSNEPLMP
jgi:DNA primase